MSAATCPVCGRGVYCLAGQTLGNPTSREMPRRSTDRTLRHSDDGTVAVLADGTVVCQVTEQQEVVAS